MLKSRQIKSLLLVFIITSSTFVNAKDIPHKLNTHRIQRTERVKRQSDAMGTILQTALKFAPIIIDTFTGGGGGVGGGGGLGEIIKLVGPLLGGASNSASPSTPTKIAPVKDTPTTVNKVDKIGGDTDIFSWGNILSVGIKVALSLISSYTSGGGIDRDGNEITPMQTALGTLISALTGSDNPREVAVMAKQAVDVVYLLGTTFDALRTSIF